MLCSSNNVNNLHINMYVKVERPEWKLTQVNTIEYDAKSCQVMRTIVNFTWVQQNILKIITSHRRDVDTVNKYVTQLQYFKYDVISSMQQS